MPFEALQLSIWNALTVLTFPVREAAVLAAISTSLHVCAAVTFIYFFPTIRNRWEVIGFS